MRLKGRLPTKELRQDVSYMYTHDLLPRLSHSNFDLPRQLNAQQQRRIQLYPLQPTFKVRARQDQRAKQSLILNAVLTRQSKPTRPRQPLYRLLRHNTRPYPLRLPLLHKRSRAVRELQQKLLKASHRLLCRELYDPLPKQRQP